MLSASEYLATAQQLGKPYIDGGANENYLRYLERTGFLHSHHVALNGGTESSNYRASVAYREREMVVKNNSSNNFVAKIDLSQRALNEQLRIDFGLFTSTQQRADLYDGQRVFYGAAAQNPTYPCRKKWAEAGTRIPRLRRLLRRKPCSERAMISKISTSTPMCS